MSLDRDILDELIKDFKHNRDRENSAQSAAEVADLAGFRKGMLHVLHAFDVPFEAMVASDDLAEIEPKFRIAEGDESVTVDEAVTIIGWCRKQAESIHEDAPELRELLANPYKGYVFQDVDGPGIRFHTGGLAWSNWRPDSPETKP